MKSSLLVLLAAAPIFAGLAPRAEAAAIIFNSGGLQPRMLGPASFKQRHRAGLPGSAFRTAEAKLNRAITDALNASGSGTIKTGGGTLEIGNSGFIIGATLTAGGGTLSLISGSVRSFSETGAIRLFPASGLVGTIDANGFNVSINGGTIFDRMWTC